MIHRGIDKINVGDFVNKVKLLKPQTTRNSRGAGETDWIESAAIYGKLDRSAADEVAIDQNLVNPDTIKLTTYVRRDVSSSCRLDVDGQLYDIVSVATLLTQPLMIITAEKITDR